MRLTLKPHPDTPCEAVRAIAVEVARERDGWLKAVYRLEGDIDAILWPELSEARRVDGLWQHTCFEAFVGPVGVPGYLEMNMSPGLEWAMYSFTGYRAGMTPTGDAAFGISCHRGEAAFDLSAEIAVGDLSPAVAWRLGLSAVIELKDGSKSYWALAHAPGPPDFHHPDAFAAILPPESP
ncbi:DOMON-like domain-containing protein [Caulobacter sp. NIBR1757]|uniref:DOMON-like domain-containing protein n=1 Tax=Caulobacter sp. NIBR1757 TaxID=3016000 RepID=UPI0022F05680|nr:DOMON-like domain-containing protein [Caulobacter sp. NIBR1757]WGM39558.1 hypothetical protein AMEJIAPC_02482 [Caulobacter sp. NIBR1757]